MKHFTIKAIAFSILLLLVTPLGSYAESSQAETMEGILRSIKHSPTEGTQIKLDANWYPLDDKAKIFICGERYPKKTFSDLAEFEGRRLNISPSATADTFNTIKIMCE